MMFQVSIKMEYACIHCTVNRKAPRKVYTLRSNTPDKTSSTSFCEYCLPSAMAVLTEAQEVDNA